MRLSKKRWMKEEEGRLGMNYFRKGGVIFMLGFLLRIIRIWYRLGFVK